ncbi:MAG: hypothetical protein V3S41_05140 [Spirochaetia bacterium]
MLTRITSGTMGDCLRMTPEAGSVPGSPNQIKYGAFELSDWARTSDDDTRFLRAIKTRQA